MVSFCFLRKYCNDNFFSLAISSIAKNKAGGKGLKIIERGRWHFSHGPYNIFNVSIWTWGNIFWGFGFFCCWSIMEYMYHHEFLDILQHCKNYLSLAQTILHLDLLSGSVLVNWSNFYLFMVIVGGKGNSYFTLIQKWGTSH